MSDLDFIPVWVWLIGVAYGLYLMFTPKWCLDIECKVREKIRSQTTNWNWERVLPRNHGKVSLRGSKSRVPVSIDPTQSQVSYHGPNGIGVTLLAMVSSGLDHNSAFEKLELSIETKRARLPCRFQSFTPSDTRKPVTDATNIRIAPRKAIVAWIYFHCSKAPRIADFRKFVLTTKIVGEPRQTHAFKPCDWAHARAGQSEIVTL
jgi:hypothetical protein